MTINGSVVLLLLAGLGALPVRLAAQPDHIFSYTKTPTPVPAASSAALDQAQACTSSAASLSGTCACLAGTLAAWQGAQDKDLAGLRAALSGTAAADGVDQSQSAWLRFRDREFALLDLAVVRTPDAAARVCAVKAALVAARAKDLELLAGTIR
ncbi:MAG TPA: hypothetical protein VK842_10090 [bacterium]|nr:hypothetical protein [bacterium]